MHIERIALRNFRNYELASLDFSPDLNLISGSNGEGKSNLLEALYFLIVGRSFRSSRGSELVRLGEEQFTLEALFHKQGVSQRLLIQYSRSERTLIHNQTRHSSLLPLFGMVAGVLFAPSDSQLIGGPPAERRRFLDLHLSQTDPLYLYHLNRYHRAMKQRNRLLHLKQLETIVGWEVEMARSASYIVQERGRCTAALETWACELQQRVSGGRERLSLAYRPASPTDLESIVAAYAKARPREALLGHTLIGPHRDELLIYLDGREARHFASVGQSCCSAIALRLAEWHRLRDEIGEPPLMLLDDATAALDQARQRRFYQLLEETGQLFLAAPELLALPTHSRPARCYRVASGSLTELDPQCTRGDLGALEAVSGQPEPCR